MSKKTYICLFFSDGDVNIHHLYGSQVIDLLRENPEVCFLQPESNWSRLDVDNFCGWMVVDGDVVWPTPKEVVREWELP